MAGRDVQIPLVLWISTAIVAHMLGGGGAVEVAKVAQDRADLRAVARGVREQLHPADLTFQLLTDDAQPTPGAKVAPPENAPDDGTADKGDPDPTAVEADKTKPPPPPKAKKADPPKDPPKLAEAKTAPTPPPPPAPPPPPPAAVPVPAVPAPPPPPAPPLEPDHRIAVRQNAAKDQPDNPTANRIADEANHVDEETMAKVRAHDQDDPNPTPGTHKGPKSDDPGNSDHDKIADSEDHKGDEKHAPGESDKASVSPEHNNPAPPKPGPIVHEAASIPGGKGAGAAAARLAPPSAPPPTPGGAGPASPEVKDAERGGGYTLDPANPGGDGKSRVAGKKRSSPSYDSPVHVGSLGLNGSGVPGGPNFNITQAGVEAAVGPDKLKQERAADGAARRSARLGSYESNKWERWRAAIENYEPSVKPGNQTALNAARVPFATYINGIHNRLHPIFAEEFLASLDSLPKSHALNQPELITHIEIVLSKDQGRIVRMGVTRTSGNTAFDIVALNSVSRAQPFGKAPEMIISPDGNVYLHWEFHRDPFDACTTRNARPFLLATAPSSATPAPLAPRRPGAAGSSDDTPGGVPGPLLPLRAH
jgi:hypothetical protein